MIDRRSTEPPTPNPSLALPIPGVVDPEPQSASNVADLYDKLFSESAGWESESVSGKPAADMPRDAAAATAPPAPLTLRQTGLTLGTISDLILKQLYLQGNLLGIQFARQMRLPFAVVEEGLRFLKDDKCIEVTSGDLVGPVSYRFNLTEGARLELSKSERLDHDGIMRIVGALRAPMDHIAPGGQLEQLFPVGSECKVAPVPVWKTRG